jgi:DNA-binding LytR/AlgR family response regulator
LKVIICDDDPNQRDSILICLEVSGSHYEFIEFELGDDADDYLETNEA